MYFAATIPQRSDSVRGDFSDSEFSFATDSVVVSTMVSLFDGSFAVTGSVALSAVEFEVTAV